VEPACGAAVAALYGGVIQRLQSEGTLPAKMESGIVVIVCGGISITQNMLAAWKKDFQLE
jgi:L-serine/L-threonine ammonia-lyase